MSVQQISAADKELFTIVSQHSRGELRIVAGSPAPLDAFFQKYMDSSEVVCYMNPLPASQQSNPPVRDKAAENPGGVKGKGDNPGKGKGKGKGPSIADLLKKHAKQLREQDAGWKISVSTISDWSVLSPT